jgi:hypothetical protein
MIGCDFPTELFAWSTKVKLIPRMMEGCLLFRHSQRISRELADGPWSAAFDLPITVFRSETTASREPGFFVFRCKIEPQPQVLLR